MAIQSPSAPRRTVAAAASITAAAAGATALAVRHGIELASAGPLVLAAAAPVLAYRDVTQRRILNRDLLCTYAVVLGLAAAEAVHVGDPAGLLSSLAAGASVLVVACVVCVASGGLGGGDAKLLGLVAFVLAPGGWWLPVAAVLYATLVATAALIVFRVVAAIRGQPGIASIAMAPHILIGAFVAAWTAP